MKTQSEYIEIINKAISEIHYPNEPKGLYSPIEYTLDCGGKRLRPMLVLAACEACGGQVSDAMSQALGIEMFHNFTLLHDDVMDRADVRRGKPTVHKKWNESTAILSGDAMLTMATRMMTFGTGDKLPDVMALFNDTAMEIYEGQQYDMDFESRDDVTVGEYMEMIRLKTSVLLGCACAVGALMAGASEEVRRAFYRYGEALGLAFQLQDDWLDTYGDPATFGKSIGGDILNDKKTYLLITAMNKADEVSLNRIKSWFGTRSEEKVREIKEIYDKLGAADECRSMIDNYLSETLRELDGIDIPVHAKEFFRSYAEKSINRKS